MIEFTYRNQDEGGQNPLHSPAIECRNVAYRRSDTGKEVLQDVSLTVNRGEWVCLTGANGSGKSTLIRLMAGLLKPTGGTVSVFGQPVTAGTIHDIRGKIGMVFAEPDDQFIGLTVADDIAFGLGNRNLDRGEMEKRIGKYAGLLGISHLLDRHPATLSGGQKQLAAMAAVLAMEPAILLLDEAGSMLDDLAREQFAGVLRQLSSTGDYAIVSASHHPDEMAMADRLFMLSDGRVLAEGKPEELLASDEWTETCRITPPFALQFCRELARLGIGIGCHLDERKAVEALWTSLSTMSPAVTGTERRISPR